MSEFCNEWSPIMMAKPETSQFELQDEKISQFDGNVCQIHLQKERELKEKNNKLIELKQ